MLTQIDERDVQPKNGSETPPRRKLVLPSTDVAEIYLDAIRREASRTLGLLDREPLSPTRGCMDRTYWAWKFTDFPGARFQEGLCVLSFLWARQFEGSPFFGNPRLRDWITAGFDYWARIQYKGGDFDEAYPFERSLAATAFSANYLAEAWSFLEGELPQNSSSRFRQALERAGDWLIRNDEKHGFLSNHLAAAATALLHTYRITGKERFEERSCYFLEKILDHQSKEGWYNEYGGADPGYQTHGSFYLARYYQLDPKQSLLDSLNHSVRFLAHFVHPDGSLGGEYASRNTQTYYPAAFEMLSGTSGSAHWVAANMLSSVKNGSAAGLASVDAYNYFPLLNNYVFAYLACLEREHRSAPREGPSELPGVIHFPDAGLIKRRESRYDLFIGLAKGGVVKAFDRQTGKLIRNDCGYLGRLTNGQTISSQGIDPDREVCVTDEEVVIKGRFFASKRIVQRPLLFVGFRLFSLTLGRLPRASSWLKSLLVKVLIYRKKPLDLHFERQVRLGDEGFTVRDRLHGSAARRIQRLCWVDVFTTIHMGSSRYFTPNELENPPEGDELSIDIDVNQLQDEVIVERTTRVDV